MEPHAGCVEKANDVRLSFGDTIPGMEFEWVEAGDLLVGRSFAGTGISWIKLNAQNLVQGQIVQIDGQYFMCRCLKVGATSFGDSEWADILKRCGDSDDVWGNRNESFWGQEEHPVNPSFRMLGRRGEWTRGYAVKDSTFHLIGFRPALEPVKNPSDPDLRRAMHKRIKLWFPLGPVEGPIEGTLIECSDYDVTIRTKQKVKEVQPYIRQDGNEIIIARCILTWMTKNHT